MSLVQHDKLSLNHCPWQNSVQCTCWMNESCVYICTIFIYTILYGLQEQKFVTWGSWTTSDVKIPELFCKILCFFQDVPWISCEFQRNWDNPTSQNVRSTVVENSKASPLLIFTIYLTCCICCTYNLLTTILINWHIIIHFPLPIWMQKLIKTCSFQTA